VSSCSIKVPFKVTMDICGSFSVQVLEAEDYSLEVADKEFAGYLKDAVLDAFVVSKSNDSGVAILDVSMNSGSESDFEGAIVTQLQRALMNVSGDNLEIYLKDWANTELLADLRANGMAAALEGDGINELAYDDLEGSYEAGAAALWDGLVALPPQKRSLIATQIPNKNWMAARNGFDVDDDQHHQITYLPLKAGGDSMTFQFQIEQHFSVSTEAMPNYDFTGTNNTDNITTGTSAYAGHLSGETTYGVDKRIVNIVLTRAAPKDYPDVSGQSPYTVPTRASVLGSPVSDSVNDLSGAVDSAQTAFNSASVTAEESYQTWKTENAIDIAYKMHESRKNVAQNKFVAAQAALVKALADLSGNPSSLSLKVAAELAKDKVEAAQADRESFDVSPPSPASDLATKLSTSQTDASAAADAHRDLVAAKRALAAGEAMLAQEINKANELQEKYDALYESAQDASGESGEIWTDASGHVAELTTELETLVSDLSGARSEAHQAYLDASGSANPDPTDAIAVQADIDDKVALAEKRAAFLAAKVAAEEKLADVSGSVATANLKLADYALFYVYAQGLDALAGAGAAAVTAFYNARERSVPAITPAGLLDEDLSNAN